MYIREFRPDMSLLSLLFSFLYHAPCFLPCSLPLRYLIFLLCFLVLHLSSLHVSSPISLLSTLPFSILFVIAPSNLSPSLLSSTRRAVEPVQPKDEEQDLTDEELEEQFRVLADMLNEIPEDTEAQCFAMSPCPSACWDWDAFLQWPAAASAAEDAEEIY